MATTYADSGYDPTKKRKEPSVYDYLASADTVLTPGDVKRGQEAALAEYGVNAGVGAALGAGQLGLSFIDTPQDTYNTTELKKLEQLEKGNKLGLTGEERQVAEETLMNPVRSFAADTARRTESRLASSGGASVADQVRAQRQEEKAVSDASVDASQRIVNAHLARKEAQRAEMEQRRAYESERQTSRIAMLGQTVAGLAQNFGKVAAGMAVKSRMTDGQISVLQNATDDAGHLLYPGLSGSIDDARTKIESGSQWMTDIPAATGGK